MHQPKTIQTAFAVPASRVFDAALAVAQDGKYTISGVDNAQHKLAFSSGKTLLSWGQEYQLQVQSTSDTDSVLHVVCGGIDGAPKALMDGVKNKKIANKLVAKISAVVDGSNALSATPVESFGLEA